MLRELFRRPVLRASSCQRTRRGLPPLGRRARSTSCLAQGLLLEAAAEETDDNAGADPIVGLMRVGTERSAVVVGVEQTDFEVAGRMDVQATAHFERNAVHRSGVAAGAADGGVSTRGADQAFHKRSKVPAILPAVVVAGPIVIAVEHVLGVADGDEAVAAVANDLQPGLEIPAE